MSVLVWMLVGIALWHFTVLLPDRFHGGIIGAFLYAVAGALLAGWALPVPGVPPDNPPGLQAALWPLPGALAALAIAYWWGARVEQEQTCPRCRMPAPRDADECPECGWDLHEAYHAPSPAPETDRV